MDDTRRTSFPKRDLKVLLLEGIHPRAAEIFAAAGYSDVERLENSFAGVELARRLAKVHFLGIRSRTRLPADVLARAERLVGVGCFCIGTDRVDLAAAQDLGVPVFNAPYSNTRSVAELVVAQAVLLLRRVPEKNALCHRGQWAKSAAGAVEARDKSIGIVGYGRIGTQVGLLAEALGMRVSYYDIESKLALGNARPALDLDALLAASDVVTLHVPETNSTTGMIGRRELGAMKAGAVLINASRGRVVDLEELAAALDSRRLSGAAIDVHPSEPGANDEPFHSPLRGRDNVLLTPHIAGSTLEAQENIAVEVATKLVKYSDNGSTVSAVNFPEVSLPPHPGSHRLLHIHRNEPGMLSQVNEVFSARHINIDAQYLQTTARVGYVVLDIDTDEDRAQAARESLAAIPGTLRTRILY
jgi:D-3-phosphoglycerate dehydrogenase / 2-oxoglutarate reductase